jgi:hypothetical protein
MEIAALVTRLLAHYWTATEPAAVRQAQIEDWLDDLGEFAPPAVADACREWRRAPGGRRPTPGDIRRLCIESRQAQQERLLLAAPIDRDGYARSIGWTSEAERQAAIANGAERMRRRERELAASATGRHQPMTASDREQVARELAEFRARWEAATAA